MRNGLFKPSDDISVFLLVAFIVIVSGCIAFPTEQEQEELESGPDSFAVETVAEGLEHPWGIEFLSEDYVVVTEREEGISIVDKSDGSVEEISGLPEFDTRGQGGLLDVEAHPEYPEQPYLYFSYSASNDEGETATYLGRGALDLENSDLTDFEVLHTVEPFVDSNIHYGSRIMFDEDEYLYMTTGDRGFKNFGTEHVSQDRSNDLGATLRLQDDGSVPEDNPFVQDENISDYIYSYGHRNSQGMTLHPETGEIWQSEHGEEDGDEINLIRRGGNYGWPITHTGCEYGTDRPVAGDPFDNPEVEDPLYHWECGSGGFPPAGMDFYSGEMFEQWEGDLFIGNLAGAYLGHFEVEGDEVAETEPLLQDRDWRIRDVEEDPQTGEIYVLVDDRNAPLVKLTDGE